MTSTIGRPELALAIKSVQNQTYPCKHYVFVDGNIFWDKAKSILEQFPDVIPIYLPMNTGKNGILNGAINAAAAFLVEEDIICYLDDDNQLREDHVESLVKVIEQGSDFAYSLRSFYDSNQQFICHDDYESLGNWTTKENMVVDVILEKAQQTFDITHNTQNLVDTNCYAIPREIALKATHGWYTSNIGDRAFFSNLKSLDFQGQTSGKYTVKYTVDLDKIISFHNFFPGLILSDEMKNKISLGILKEMNQQNIEYYGGRPWAKE
ncbi:glycosyltransferase family 2 protein [Haemophilus haemolyticus]|uniref:glycosyltransferase family 2 protein n=1 Tax=Haemophilus haemolyticus TaxID=726 RepID=UPI001EFE0C9A|nr:glycosyltransferase [Haemophilus haemolyticus]